MRSGRRRPSVQQVTAALVERDGRFLLARRKPGRHMGCLWEFPGGKVDPGESAEACLARELAEELGVIVRVGSFVASTRFQVEGKEFELLLYRVEHLSGEFQLREHEEVRWVAPADLEALELVDSDRELARVLSRGTRGRPRRSQLDFGCGGQLP